MSNLETDGEEERKSSKDTQPLLPQWCSVILSIWFYLERVSSSETLPPLATPASQTSCVASGCCRYAKVCQPTVRQVCPAAQQPEGYLQGMNKQAANVAFPPKHNSRIRK